MRWAIAFHPDQIDRRAKGRSRLMVPPSQIPEDRVAVAKSQGWIVLITESEVFGVMGADLNLHSNPRRVADDGDGA